jgi:hypothetical protein
MDPAARALEIIKGCLDQGRYVVTVHFAERMEQRGLMWPDIVAVVDDPSDVRNDGKDVIGRPKWLVAGQAADGLPIEIVCVLDEDAPGLLTVLVTVYWR